jgi:anti-sigma factor (TIGR02949 family)
MASAPETCKEIFSLLSGYLDLDLPEVDCQHIRQHLAGCPPCVEFLESLRKTVALCHECGTEAAPPPLSDAARAQLEKAWRQMVAAGRHGSSNAAP